MVHAASYTVVSNILLRFLRTWLDQSAKNCGICPFIEIHLPPYKRALITYSGCNVHAVKEWSFPYEHLDSFNFTLNIKYVYVKHIFWSRWDNFSALTSYGLY